MDVAARKKQLQIPQEILARVNEFSSGGFILFTFDEEGNPNITSCFDSQTHAIAMQYYIRNWSNALDNITLNITAQNIMHGQRTRKKEQ